ncbi:MAG: Eco57I restriction-modification methylase domain-containing protein [Saprospiraceae bacterium]|nr:Eco57I restriction-modification methylase domain-containing protein [Saprospiraceae bacterium]
MNSSPLKPRQALNKAYLKVKPSRADIEAFKANLIRLLDRSNDKESEEFHKNLVSDFLKDTYYKKNYFINTKGRNDLVVHNGHDASTTVGVIIEAKKFTNKAEMVGQGKLNAKAFQELVLYYLRERITHKNIEVKHLVITNIYEWYIFDATIFDRHFAQHKGLVKQFQDFEAGRLAEVKTDFFYKQIAEPFIAELKADIEYTYFDLRDYQRAVRNADKEDDNLLIALYKLLSPEHLLKLPFANDSNSLDKRFYSELLHIIGLTESKDGSKKLIGRSKEAERHHGTLLESAINQLDAEDRIRRIERPAQFGATMAERLYNVALELTLTWVNRILFLKLLEAQLISYHKGDKSYAFLNGDKIKSYDDLNSLFFQVLARKQEDRQSDVKTAFDKVPYLNSSLFEPTDIEQNTLFISNLRDDRTIPIFGQTVLKDDTGKKRTGQLATLDYLFQFLDAYDFGSEGSEDIQEDNKSLINASVLGLIFEKINGYKDGSFFTPGFITMYMCRETIRRAVVQKFNETKSWSCENFDELYDKIGDRQEANAIVNSLSICDPAVGSGHFLVSALNEVIAVKNDLKILQDRDGKRLKEYHVEVVNDELIVTDDEGELFEYKPGNKESQRMQETLFHEKQTIIENCLFGVDINPNSVKICRLRLWIELLKNAYYKTPTELETLPNIDINIKCGNSLVSRFAIDADLGQALKKSKWTIDSYRLAVDTYRNAQDKEQKREMESLIEAIKTDFRSEITLNDPKMNKLRKLKGDLFNTTNQLQLFDRSPKELAEWEKQVKKFQIEIEQLEKEIEEIKANKIFENAFEWRFEFPEVLNENGDFVGFDVVIGNPPYIRQEELGDFKNHLQSQYKVFTSGGDIFSYFYELSHCIMKDKGYFSFINNTFDKTTAGKTLREFVENNFRFDRYIDFTDVVVFEEATTYPIILITQKANHKSNFKFLKYSKANFHNKDLLSNESAYTEVSQEKLQSSAWNFINSFEQNLLNKIQNYNPLVEKYGKCFRGIITGLNEAFITENNLGSFTVLKDVYDGKDLKKWTTPLPFKKMIVFESKSTSKRFGKINEEEAFEKMKETYSEIFYHLEPFKENALKRYDKGEFWWELRNCAYYDLFEKPKIIFPNLQNNNKFAFDDKGIYLNAPAVFLPTSDKALLAILNSKVVWHFLKSICVIRSGGYIEVKPQYFEQIPIPDIDVKVQTKLSVLVDTAIQERAKNQQVDITDQEAQIDRLVYELYGLSEEEIKIVEEAK